MWEKFRKVNRNYKPKIVLPLDRGGNIITSPDEIADYYANISKDLHKKSKPRKNRNNKREEDRELKAAINQQKNTAPGEDTIPPQMIKKTTTRDAEVPARYVQ